MPTLGAHVDEEFYKAVQDAANEATQGKVSAWIKIAAEEKLRRSRGELTVTDTGSGSQCLVDLAERFAPVYAADIRKACGDAEQPKILEMMLVAFAKEDSETSLSESFRTRVERAVSRGKPDSKRPPAPR